MQSSKEQQGKIKKPSSVNNAKKQRQTTEWEKTRDLFKKIRDTKGTFHAEMGSKKERDSNLNAEFQRIARRNKKVFLSEQCKEIEENNGIGRLEISVKS